MILDKELRFSNGQAITASAASTDIVDLGVARNAFAGNEMYLVLQLTASMTDSGSDSTLTVDLEADNDSAFGSVDNALRVPGLTGVAGAATFPALSAAGARRIVAIPPALFASRYMRCNFTVTGGNLTTGSISAFITSDVDAYRAYTAGITIEP